MEAKAGPAPLAYLIVRADVVADLAHGAAACWALQASHVLDAADDADQARYAAQAAVRRTGAAVCILAVTVAETVEPTPAGPETTNPPDEDEPPEGFVVYHKDTAALPEAHKSPFGPWYFEPVGYVGDVFSLGYVTRAGAVAAAHDWAQRAREENEAQR